MYTIHTIILRKARPCGAAIKVIIIAVGWDKVMVFFRHDRAGPTPNARSLAVLSLA